MGVVGGGLIIIAMKKNQRLFDGFRGKVEATLFHIANNILQFIKDRKRTIIAYFRNDAFVLE